MAVKFNGSNNYAYWTMTGATAALTSFPFTMGGWARLSGAGVTPVFMCLANGAGGQSYEVYPFLSSPDKITSEYWSGSAAAASITLNLASSSTTTLYPDNWIYFVAQHVNGTYQQFDIYTPNGLNMGETGHLFTNSTFTTSSIGTHPGNLTRFGLGTEAVSSITEFLAGDMAEVWLADGLVLNGLIGTQSISPEVLYSLATRGPFSQPELLPWAQIVEYHSLRYGARYEGGQEEFYQRGASRAVTLGGTLVDNDLPRCDHPPIDLANYARPPVAQGIEPQVMMPKRGRYAWFQPANTSGPATINQSVDITATSTTTVVKQVGKLVGITATTAMAMQRAMAKIVLIGATSSVSFVKQAGKIVAAVATSTTAVARAMTKVQAVNAVATSTTSIARSVGKGIAIVGTSTTSLRKAVGKIVAITATSTTAVQALKVFLVSVNITATSTTVVIKQAGKTIAITATSTTALAKAVAKVLGITATSAVAILKSVAKQVGITATSTVTLAAQRAYLVTVSITATSTTALVKAVGKIVNVTATSSTALGPKAIGKAVAIVATSAVDVRKAIAITRSIVATSSTSITKAIGKLVGIVATSAVSQNESFVPAGVTYPQTVNITVGTVVTIDARFIPADPTTIDSHDVGERELKFWRDKGRKGTSKTKRAKKDEPPIEVVLAIPADVLAQLDEQDIQDIIDLLGL